MRNRRLVRLAVASSLLALVGGGAALALRARTSAPIAEPEPVSQAELEEAQAPLPTALPIAAAGSIGAGAASTAIAPAPTPELGPAPRVPGRHERPFGKASSFSDALTKAGLAEDEANAVIAALSGKLDFRRAHADDLLIIERGPEAHLERFEYRASLTSRYEAKLGAAGGFEGREIEVPIAKLRVARGGIVQGSLDDALDGLKLGRSLSGVFADVFAGKVNFSTDTRAGDTFRVIVEEERIEGALLRYGTIHALEYRGAKVGLLRAFWHESPQTEGDFFDPLGRALHGGWLRTPIRYERISSDFGMRFHPVLRRKQLHNGIDYAASPGTHVRAAAAGVVRFAGRRGPNGNLLALTHSHGYETFYAHLARFAPGIKPGVRVKQRQVVAYVGSTGRSTGPHLHFSLKRAGRIIDPNAQLNGPGLPLPARELPAFKRRVAALIDELERIPLEQPEPVTPPPVAPAVEFDDVEL